MAIGGKLIRTPRKINLPSTIDKSQRRLRHKSESVLLGKPAFFAVPTRDTLGLDILRHVNILQSRHLHPVALLEGDNGFHSSTGSSQGCDCWHSVVEGRPA